MQNKKRLSGHDEAAIEWDDEEMNKDQQGNDKAPGEENGKGEKVTMNDLKGKQVDEDPSTEIGKPLSQ